MKSDVDVVVAGHICLDVIPAFQGREGDLSSLLVPGHLIEMGEATISTGGAVSNTGLSLHRLGIKTRLMGKVGDDLWGRAILDHLGAYDPELVRGMIVVPGEATSYTVVLSPPGQDRIFLHAPGANNTFSEEDVPYDQVPAGGLFHFGYPPLMARMYEDGGNALASIFRRVKEAGAVTSLDMAMPDPRSRSGKADWKEILRRVLPYVDIFLPSVEEMLLMLRPDHFGRLSEQAGSGGIPRLLDGELVSDLAGQLLAMGAGIVGLKAGDQGLYMRTSDRERLSTVLEAANRPASGPKESYGPKEWQNDGGKLEIEARKLDQARVLDAWAERELWLPCFAVDVAGTTGAGDATVAGFLAAWVEGASPEQAMELAVAVGAFSVEAADATSGVAPIEKVKERIQKGWARRELSVRLAGWSDRGDGLWAGPNDQVEGAKPA